MLNVKEALAADIAEGLVAAKLVAEKDLPTVVVDRAEKSEHGDYASPIALALAKQLKQKPMDLVAEIAQAMPKKEYLGKLEAAEPGFLNIFVRPEWLTARLDDVIEHELCRDIAVGEGKSANLEYISANPTGPMTLGNLRNGFTADTLANIMECAGYDVTREYYINDAGNQVKRLGESVLRRALQAQGKEIDFPEELYQGEYIKDVAATIAEQSRENERKELEEADLTNADVLARISREAVELLQADNRQTIEQLLKIEFDVWTSEQELRDDGGVAEAVKLLAKKKLTYDQDGATWLKTTEFGDDKDQVLVKDDGEYTYFAPDIAYNRDKAARGYDQIITFLGADHLAHIPKMLAAMEAVGEKPARWHYQACQLFRLVKDGKPVRLSKRKGAVATPADLINEVGYDAARFFFLRQSLTSHMDFDLGLAKEQSDRNPVYYVQYAFVRLQSILRRAKQEGVIENVGDAVTLTSNAQLTQPAEVGLLKQLYRFPEVVTECAASLEPHPLAYYASDVAKSVHRFYKEVPVLAAADGELTRSRLQLVLAARKVLGKTLDLLGVSKPDVM